MAITSSSSETTTPTSGFTLEQKSSSNPDGSWNIWYVQTSSSGTRRVQKKWRSFTGSKGLNWRDTDPSLRPVRPLFDESGLVNYGGVQLVTTTLGQGGSRYISNSQQFDRGYLDYTLINDLNLINDAKQKFLDKVRDLAVSVPVMAAEVGKTTHHLLDTANRVYVALRALKHGDLKKVAASLHSKRHKREAVIRRKILKSRRDYLAGRSSLDSWSKDFSNLWLEYQYAWKPLISDVQKSAELLAQHHLDGDYLKPKRVVVNLSRTASKTSYDSGYYRQVAKCDSTLRVGGFVTYRLSVSNLALQTGMTDPLGVAWELIPFSFVADWFTNIGDILSAYTALRSFSFTACWQSQLHVQTTKTDLIRTVDTTWPYITTYSWLQQPSSKIRRYTRDIYIPSVPALRLKSDPFSLSHSITSLALVCQKIKSVHL